MNTKRTIARFIVVIGRTLYFAVIASVLLCAVIALCDVIDRYGWQPVLAIIGTGVISILVLFIIACVYVWADEETKR